MSNQNNGYGVKNVQVVPVTTFLTKYTDGNGEEETRMGFVVGNEVRFLEQKSLSKPVQSWLANEICRELGISTGPKTAEAPPAAVEVSSDSASLETQV